MHGISDSVALVTGAGSGIGRATAERFAREGAAVLIVDIDDEAGRETVSRIENAGGDAAFTSADVSDSSAVEQMVERAVAEYGRLDFAVNNAAAGNAPAPITDRTEAEWDRVVDVTQKGVWLGMKHEIPAMLDSGGGAIVNMSSMAGIAGSPGRTPYSASKHGVVGLTRTVALEYAQENIRANTVCPTIVNTPALQAMSEEEQTEVISDVPMGRPAEPDEIAGAVLWLCSDDASFVTGHTLPVDGGAAQQ